MSDDPQLYFPRNAVNTWLHEIRALHRRADPVFEFVPAAKPSEAFWMDGKQFEDARPRIVMHESFKDREQEFINFFAAKRSEERRKLNESLYARQPDPYTLDLQQGHPE